MKLALLRTRLLVESDPQDLEDAINEYLEQSGEAEVHGIQYQAMTDATNGPTYSALIMFIR